MKNYYYVIVATNKGAQFVTKTDNATKTAWWSANEEPKALTKTYAEDLAYCLMLNFYPAYVLKSYHQIKKQILMSEEEKND